MREQARDYEALDQSAIEYLVTCELRGTRFYLSDNAPINSATDILGNARRFRDIDGAATMAHVLGRDAAYTGEFKWRPVRLFPVTGALLFDDGEVRQA